MTVPASGTIRLSLIRGEVTNNSYLIAHTSSSTKLSEVSDGTHGTINITNLNENKPDTISPHLMGEFYKYEHNVLLSTSPLIFSLGSSSTSNNTITVNHAEYSTWYVSSKPSWVTITQGSTSSSSPSTGDGSVKFSTTANTGSSRQGDIVVTLNVGTTGSVGNNSTTTRTSTVSQSGSGGSGPPPGGGGGGRGLPPP